MEAATAPSFEPDATHKRVLDVIQEASQPLRDNSTGFFEEFLCQGESLAGEFEFKTSRQQRPDDRRSSENDKICHMLLEAAKEPSNHIKAIDDAIRRLAKLRITFSLLRESDLASRAIDVLNRMPQHARFYREENDERIMSRLDSAFFIYEADKRTQENLRVTKFLPTPVIQLAVLVTLPIPQRQDWHGQATRQFANLVADCLEITLGFSPGAIFGALELFVVRSYLWNLWHRCLTLHRYYILRLHLDFGFNYPVHQALKTRGLAVEEIVRNQRQKCGELMDAGSEMPEKINGDALDLLRADPSAVGINFKPLYHHFGRALKTASSTTPRTHTPYCDGSCSYVTRTDNDFLSPTKTVAVALLPAHETQLQYCEASMHTMLISTSWTQTRQGSAIGYTMYPACWHEKFCALARKSGCDSYWTDSVCLPVEKTARKRAMESVNSVFENSKLTVVCDGDIMTLDKSENEEKDSSYMEKVLAIMLVCDWNLEAWSLVAALKGARTLHLLCKDDVLLPVHVMTQAVHERGSLELANLSLLSYHVLRPSTSWVLSSKKTLFWSDSAGGIFTNRDTRILAVEEAGRLLEYRRTNHETDHLHIWCLLTGVPIVDTASELWWHVREIHTGYIFSTMPRILKTVDFTWAPNGPGLWHGDRSVPSHLRQWSAWYYQQSEIAEHISTSGNHLKGLWGVWNFCSLENFNLTKGITLISGQVLGLAGELRRKQDSKGLISTLKSLKLGICPLPTDGQEWHAQNKIAVHMNKISAAWNLLQQPAASRKELSRVLKEFSLSGGHIALIYPHACNWDIEDYIEASTGSDTITLAVILSDLGDQYGSKWRWLTTIEWDKSVQLPSFQRRRIRLT